MKVAELIETVRDGDEHGWATEFEWLRLNRPEEIRALALSVLTKGFLEPVLIGNDGRLWDGHHRVYVAHVLGYDEIPVTTNEEGDSE